MNFLWLVFAHMAGDIALQTPNMANKDKYWYVMAAHCVVWTGCICVALAWLGLLEPWKPFFLFAGHFVSDEWKSHQPKTPDNWWKIYPDQAWHYVQCLAVYLF